MSQDPTSSAARDGSERRRAAQRFPHRGEVRISRGADLTRALVANLSEGGIGLCGLSCPLPLGAAVQLLVVLPRSASHHRPRLKMLHLLRAEVVWQRGDAAGLRFVDPPLDGLAGWLRAARLRSRRLAFVDELVAHVNRELEN